ncbi:MAG: YraN family protein [Thermodesulfobacteriota bacterium]|nr:YraN family protein [Thermodesulfobacteriota bacterium]
MLRPESTRNKGKKGEELARSYLKSKGFKIMDVNYCAYTGEIDIIARDQDTLVFVEVKSAAGTGFGDPLGWIPLWKQKRILRTSQAYLASKKINDSPMRFDVITVDPEKRVCHVRDAFRAEGIFSV